MPSADDKRPASLKPAGAARSLRRGDVPEEILARYLTDAARGRTLGFYVDARATRPAFRDRGDRLFVDRNDPDAIRAMVTVAEHRGWAVIKVHGAESFRREAWLEAQRRGLEIQGYTPTAREREAEARRTLDRTRRRAEAQIRPPAKPMSPQRRAAIVEAVVAARMLDPDRAQRLIDAVRARVGPIIAAVQRGRTQER
ncbi:MAG: hypothetical protein KA105_00580 [Caulobacter sp.]|nr:hypothetical protein [Caulobacter sp.]